MVKKYISIFKLTTNYLEIHADIEPRKWENSFMAFGVLGMIFYSFLSDHALNYFLYDHYLFLKGFFWVIFASGAIPYGIRATKSLTKLVIRGTIPKFGDGLSGYFLLASAVAWKAKKPILAGCFGCIGSICGASDFYQSRYNFSPLREMWLAIDNHQTAEQAWDHVKNPSTYSGSTDAPYIQDMKKEILIKTQENAALAKENAALKEQVKKIFDNVKK